MESRLTRKGKTAIVRSADPAVAEALLEREGCSPLAGRGRGEVFQFPLEDGLAVLRPYHRGGAIRLLFEDAYLFINRPRREWNVHVYLYEQGFPVPEPLGVVWERRGVAYRGAFATRAVEAADLKEFVLANPQRREEAAVRVGKIIRRMHDLGVYHADLQVRNILVARDGRIVLIDFDNACRGRVVLDTQRCRNLLRLRRSCSKHGLPRESFEAIRRGYGLDKFPWWLTFSYLLKGAVSDVLAGRERDDAG